MGFLPWTVVSFSLDRGVYGMFFGLGPVTLFRLPSGVLIEITWSELIEMLSEMLLVDTLTNLAKWLGGN